MMISLRRHMSCICLLVFAEAVAATHAEERCRVAGGGSCIDPSSQALPTDATGSMLQVKASETEELARKESPVDSVPDEVPGKADIEAMVMNGIAQGERELEKMEGGVEKELETEAATVVGAGLDIKKQAEKEIKTDEEIVQELENNMENEVKGEIEYVVKTTLDTEKQVEKELKTDEEMVQELENDMEKEVEGEIKYVVKTALDTEKEAENEVKKLESGVLQAEEAAVAAIPEAEQEVTAAVTAAVQEAEDGGLKEVTGIAADVEKEVNAVADKVEEGFDEVGAAIAQETDTVNEFMKKEAPQIKMTLVNTEDAIEEGVASTVGFDSNMYKETKKLAKKVLHPYEAMAEASVDSELVEVKDIFSAVAHETESLGDEAKGVAHTAEDAARVGVNKAVHEVAA